MAIQPILGGLVIPRSPLGFNQVPSFSSTQLLIDAADESAAAVVEVPKTGNITKVGWRTITVTTGATVDVRVETLGSDGFPSGTLWGTNTNGSQVVAGADDNTAFLTVLTAAAAVTEGDRVAIVVKNPNTSFGTIEVAALLDDTGGHFAISPLNTGTSPAVSYARASVAPVLWLEYSDGSYAPIYGVWPISGAITQTSISTSTTPDVMGLLFRVPAPMRVSGFWTWFDYDGPVDIKLVTTAYHQANNTGVLLTKSIGANDEGSVTSAGVQFRKFPGSYDIAANTNYRLIVEPTSTTAMNFLDFELHSLSAMDAYDGGQNWMLTSAKDPTVDGDWTNYNSGTFRKPFMGIIFNGFDDAVGGGGGGRPEIRGANL